MGDFWVPIKAILEELGLCVLVPPPTSQRTLSLGARYTPELACFPLKLSIGNLLEAIECGADSVLMAGGSGPCRFGYYAQVERQVLKDLGHDVDFHVLEPPQTHFMPLLHSLKHLLGKRAARMPQALRLGWEKAKACDEIVRLCLRERAHERTRGQVTLWQKSALWAVDRADSIPATRRVLSEAIKSWDTRAVKPAERRPALKIGIVGEIFMMIEPFANLGVEEKLGHLGAVVRRKIFITDWVRTHLFPPPWRSREQASAISSARPYLNHFVGGDGLESVGYTVLGKKEGLDGIVHIMPFTCMPEIVARSVLPRVSKDIGMPVLSLSFDEHTGEAGLLTRLEAFIDLIGARKQVSG
jgi:predicted nucleotide-binding protein (sugar kinase/HSP70/actin superfamily)